MFVLQFHTYVTRPIHSIAIKMEVGRVRLHCEHTIADRGASVGGAGYRDVDKGSCRPRLRQRLVRPVDSRSDLRGALG